MREVTADATLVERDILETGSLIAALPRHEVQKHLHGDDPLGVWLDLAEDGHESLRVTVKLSSADAREALRLSGDGDVVLALDGASLQELVDEPDVEAHGIRGAVAVAVATAAVAAPAGLAANNTEVASTQLAKPALTRQVAKPALDRQVARTALKPQVAHTAYKPQVARTALVQQIHFVVLQAGVHVWR
jgi:hypothetical protein